MTYLTRPPVNGKSTNAKRQNGPAPMAINKPSLGTPKTTVMARDSATRHPVTQQWLSRFQNQQSNAPAVPVTDTTKGGRYTSGSNKQ